MHGCWPAYVHANRRQRSGQWASKASNQASAEAGYIRYGHSDDIVDWLREVGHGPNGHRATLSRESGGVEAARVDGVSEESSSCPCISAQTCDVNVQLRTCATSMVQGEMGDSTGEPGTMKNVRTAAHTYRVSFVLQCS